MSDEQQQVIQRFRHAERQDPAVQPVQAELPEVGNFDFVPCTPAGVMELLDEYKIDPKGKECVVVGRSNIVGKPMSWAC